jgi:exosome complex exonuclease RRP6
MLHYARSDTHFLLYVYDMLRNTLLDRAEGNQDQIRDVLKRSAETAMKLYQRPHYDDENGEGSGGWKGLIRNQLGQRGLLTKGPEYGRAGDMLAWGTTERGYMEERVFRKLHAWRDRTAREEDESLQ